MGEDEVAVTSGLRRSRKNKETANRRDAQEKAAAFSGGGSDKDPEPGDGAEARGRPARG